MLQTLKQHRFLLEELVKRDFERKYKGSLFGTAWSVLNPLMTLLIMRVVFGHFFGSRIPHFTTYLFCGTVVFAFFAESTSEGLMALVGNASIFTKVNVPKYLFLLSKNAQPTLCALALLGFIASAGTAIRKRRRGDAPDMGTLAMIALTVLFAGVLLVYQFLICWFSYFFHNEVNVLFYSCGSVPLMVLLQLLGITMGIDWLFRTSIFQNKGLV